MSKIKPVKPIKEQKAIVKYNLDKSTNKIAEEMLDYIINDIDLPDKPEPERENPYDKNSEVHY